MAFRLRSGIAKSARTLLRRSSSVGDSPVFAPEHYRKGDFRSRRRLSDGVITFQASKDLQTTASMFLSKGTICTDSVFCVDGTKSLDGYKLSFNQQQTRSIHAESVAKNSTLLDSIHKLGKAKEKWKTKLVEDKQIGRFTCKEISSKEEIEDAEHLLYNVYVKEHGWMFSPDNPTGFHLERRKGRMLLKDNLESHATWIGVFLNGTIVSCARIIRRDLDGKLDINRYKDSSKESLKDLLSKEKNYNLVEVQRCATHPRFRNIGVNGLALGIAAEIAYALGANVIGTTPVDSLRKFLLKCRGQVIDENFDYGDGNPTTVFYWKHETVPDAFDVIDSLIIKRIAGSTSVRENRI